jgi:phosphoserine phosphatase
MRKLSCASDPDSGAGRERAAATMSATRVRKRAKDAAIVRQRYKLPPRQRRTFDIALRFLHGDDIIAMSNAVTLSSDRHMESAREYTPLRSDHPPAGHEWTEASGASVDAVVLQVDATVSNVHGLAWLIERRDDGILTRLSELHAQAREAGWSWAELAHARLAVLRPRRAEINALGQAYAGGMLPGAVETTRRLRRAGVSVTIASEVAQEALFGVANALGLGTDEILAPRLRFDTLGAYVGCDVAALLRDRAEREENGARTIYVGTRHSEMLAPTDADSFVAFTGVVAREGVPSAARSVETFMELGTLLLP